MKPGRKSLAAMLLLLVISAAVVWFGLGDEIKGARDMRFGIDIRGGVEAVFEPVGLDRAPTEAEVTAARNIMESRLDDKNILDREVTADIDRGYVIVRFPWKSGETQFNPEAAIAELVKGKTLVVIAHKLPAIMNADQICVIDHGKLVAAGKHQDLIRSCPEYQKLWKAAQDSAEWKVHTAKEGA